jgi:hypothetical protein
MYPGGFALGNALGWVQIVDRMFRTHGAGATCVAQLRARHDLVQLCSAATLRRRRSAARLDLLGDFGEPVPGQCCLAASSCS